MKSRLRVEYLIPTDNILVLLLYSNTYDETLGLIGGFLLPFNDNLVVADFSEPPSIKGCVSFILHF